MEEPSFTSKNESWEKALADYTSEIKQGKPGAMVYLMRGECFHYLGKNSEALKDYNQALALKPNDPDSYASRVYAYCELGDIEHAHADYIKASQLGHSFRLPFKQLWNLNAP